jgi:hypothetical protein
MTTAAEILRGRAGDEALALCVPDDPVGDRVMAGCSGGER